MRVLYFSWLRDRIGIAEEIVNPPQNISTVGQLIAWLAQQSDEHAAAFADLTIIRQAVNQEYAKVDVIIGADDEVAFFPPVTGG